MRRVFKSLAAATIGVGITIACAQDHERRAEIEAIATADHPYAGFWKRPDCSNEFGLAISPAGRRGWYSVSFCGPGGCFTPGTYRPNTRLVGDKLYRILEKDTIEVRSRDGFVRYVRCPRRAVP